MVGNRRGLRRVPRVRHLEALPDQTTRRSRRRAWHYGRRLARWLLRGIGLVASDFATHTFLKGTRWKRRKNRARQQTNHRREKVRRRRSVTPRLRAARR